MMSKSPSSLLSFFSLALVSSMSLPRVSNAAIRCREAEREALLELKQRLDDPSNRLTSWVGKDCCAWKGIGCSDVTGHVIKLNLRNEHYFDEDEYYLSSQRLAHEYFFDVDEYYLAREMFGLRGDISTASSLQSLEELTHLDLSGNDFSGYTIPDFFGSFGSLTYLNLSYACFSGRVPDQLGNLSTLRHLDLSNNWYDCNDYYRDSIGSLYVENPGWIARLTSLRHLNMSWVSFGGASSWFQALNALPHIQDVELAYCQLGPFPHSPPHLNFKSLLTLNLAGNYVPEPMWVYNITTLESLNFGYSVLYWSSMNGSISKLTSLRVLDLSGSSISKNFLLSLSNLCNLQILILEEVSIKHLLSNLKMALSGCLMYNLEELHLWNNQFNGHFPSWFGNMKNLKLIDLSSNLLHGSLLVSPGSLTSLQYLNLGYNNLNGTTRESIGQLKNLINLDLSGNSLSLSLIHLGNLSSLKYLDISGNTLFMKETNDWAPPFQLKGLRMDFCNIVSRPHFPKWLQTQTTLSSLSLTNARIQDTIPNWLPSSLQYLYLNNNEIGGKLTHFFENLTRLDLSNNSLSGYLPQMANMMPSLKYLDLSENKFTGVVPQNFTKLQRLDLSKNSFSGHLPSQMENMMPNLKYLHLSDNKFTGVVPQNFTKLQTLDLSKNSFSGHLPLQMGNMMPSLEYLDLSDNKFTGVMPQNFTKLQTLDLSQNSFSGHLSLQMGNMMPSLEYLDLSNNKFSGDIPQNFTNLQVLYLSSNTFSGHLNPTINNTISNLVHLDLSINNLNGNIPHSLCHRNSLDELQLFENNFSGELPNCWNNPFLSVFDISFNQLHGEFPDSLCNLQGIQKLQLSHNNLSGRIPLCLQNCRELMVVDAGHNNFTGNIPTWSLDGLSSLQVLILRSNSLSGNIHELSQLISLQILDLSNNHFTGSIERSFSNFTAMKSSSENYYNYYSYCNLNGSINGNSWFLLFMKGNEHKYKYGCSGGLVLVIDLSDNDLSGYIPKELGNLHGLQSLNLSGNNFIGEIPSSINEMQRLEVLDLSRNNLSGKIPSTLADLTFLGILNLSYNNLSGSIPTGRQLQTFDQFSYIGNPNLCGPPVAKNCTNDRKIEEGNRNDNDKKETIWLVASFTLGFIMGFWGIWGTLLLHKRWRILYFGAVDYAFDKLCVEMLLHIRRKFF